MLLLGIIYLLYLDNINNKNYDNSDFFDRFYVIYSSKFIIETILFLSFPTTILSKINYLGF
jgi:hypothetical protein